VVTVTVSFHDDGGTADGGVDTSVPQTFTITTQSTADATQVALNTIEVLPEAFGLDSNYPNPFNPATTIRYALPEGANVTLVVYNILGQQVRTLVNGAQGPGYHSVVWDGRDEAGRMVATGVYIYRLQAGGFSQIRKMILAK
jgi:hypothetical protein